MKLARHPVRRRKTNPVCGAWSVVLIDGTKVRKKARREYEKALRDFERAKADAERFESEDKPQFAKWVSANFGALLTEIREIQEKLFDTQELVNEVQQEFYYGNYRSISAAYSEVMNRRKHPEPDEPETEEQDAEEKDFRAFFEEVFGESAEDFTGNQSGSSRFDDSRSNRSKAHARSEGRLKKLYRDLVRRLHPDKNTNRSAKQVEWWHQTQNAYEAGNVEQLELILTLVETEENGTKEATVSVLTQLTAEFKKSLLGLKRQITQWRKDLAWNFSQLTDLRGLFERTNRQLQEDRERILWLLKKYEQQIQSWQAAPAVPRKRVRATRGIWQDEEWF